MISPRDVSANPENTRHTLITLPQQIEQQRLQKMNRFLMIVVVILTAGVFILSFFVFPAEVDLANHLKNKQQMIEINTTFSAKDGEIDRLKEELVGIVSGSILHKLATLEENIKLNSIRQSLQTVAYIRTELKTLNKYAEPLTEKQQQLVQVNTALSKEVSSLRNLIYITLGSCSLMFCAFLLIWVKHKKRLLSQSSQSALTKISK
ncbi:MAG: hypothetical protein KAG10_07605 [Methylococcales bacterium]|nr:hypothetical protein [Methylococcales bacterium]MCK5925741.1 hypothetical protein [Methylococcales bacterium]